MGEAKAQNTEATAHLRSSGARQFLSPPSPACGVDSVFLVSASDPGPEGADLGPGSPLRRPKCACGSPKCPDYQAPPPHPAREELSARVAEVNRRSRRGGL